MCNEMERPRALCYLDGYVKTHYTISITDSGPERIATSYPIPKREHVAFINTKLADFRAVC